MTERETPRSGSYGAFVDKPGNDLLSHARARAVPSALEGLTSEFEMGSGMAPPTSSPEKLFVGWCLEQESVEIGITLCRRTHINRLMLSPAEKSSS